VLAGTTELVTNRLMQSGMGIAGEAFQEGKAKGYHQASQVLTGVGMAAATMSRRSRLASSVAGAALLAGSALTRFAIFEAGRISAADPRYVVIAQRHRLTSS
jgi:hypothetical protein